MPDLPTDLQLPLTRMSVAEYGRSALASGEKTMEVDGHWWREIRPFFFRPVLPYLEYQPGTFKLPPRGLVGGVQHVVPPNCSANSTIDLLMFPQVQGYSLATLNSSRRWDVRTAEKRYTIRLFTGLREFQDKAHSVYGAFFQRTQYGYLSERLRKDRFDAWAQTVYGTPGIIVLGAFAGDTLGAVSISHVVERTFVYSTFFANEDALRQRVSSLMLHTLRAAAAASGDIARIFVGMRKTGAAQSIDSFYMERGCVVQSLPASLSLNPIAKWTLRAFRPAVLHRMVGHQPA